MYSKSNLTVQEGTRSSHNSLMSDRAALSFKFTEIKIIRHRLRHPFDTITEGIGLNRLTQNLAIGLPAIADQPLRPPRASGNGEDPAAFLQRRVHFVAARLSELENRSAAARGFEGAAERQAPDQPLHESFRAGLVSAHLQRFASVLQLGGVLSWTDLEVTDVDELLGELSATVGVKKLEAKRFRRLCDHARTSGSAAHSHHK